MKKAAPPENAITLRAVTPAPYFTGDHQVIADIPGARPGGNHDHVHMPDNAVDGRLA